MQRKRLTIGGRSLRLRFYCPCDTCGSEASVFEQTQSFLDAASVGASSTYFAQRGLTEPCPNCGYYPWTYSKLG